MNLAWPLKDFLKFSKANLTTHTRSDRNLEDMGRKANTRNRGRKTKFWNFAWFLLELIKLLKSRSTTKFFKVLGNRHVACTQMLYQLS